MAANPAGEAEIREIVERAQLFQQRLDMLQQQANLVPASVDDVDNALKALGTLESQEAGHRCSSPSEGALSSTRPWQNRAA